MPSPTARPARCVRRWVVGIAADPATTGYWLVSAGGRVFAFDAPIYGSIAGYGIADAMAGIEALPGRLLATAWSTPEASYFVTGWPQTSGRPAPQGLPSP